MSKVFVTSDIHFGHDNIIKYCNRPFRDVHEMNEYVVAEWNRRVTDDDTTYILGDVSMGPRSSDPQYSPMFLGRLKGKKKIVLGNHDLPVKKFKNIGLEASLQAFPVENVEILGSDHIFDIFYMCHFPDSQFTPPNTVYLHGHEHTEFGSSNITQSIRDRKFDIGVDMYGGPVELTRDLRHLMVPKGWNV